MKYLFLVAVGLALAYASPRRQKRQFIPLNPPCADPFLNVPPVCQNNPNNVVYFPHPTDKTMFMQCDNNGRMYIIKCPMGEVFDVTDTVCRPGPVNPATPAPVTAAPVTLPPVTAAPVTLPPVTAAPVTPVPVTYAPVTQPPVNNNPCTPQALSRGQYYFPVADKTKFIECDDTGAATVLHCAPGLIWEQGILSCNYVPGGSSLLNPINELGGTIPNPCTPLAIQSNHLFFPHPDKNKFIQCDKFGDVYVMRCPLGLEWKEVEETCYLKHVV